MAQLVIAAAGAAIGGAIAPGVVALGMTGASIGWAVGSMVGAAFGPSQRVKGPRLDDLRVTGAEYGQPIPWAAGHPRVAGQIWWASDRREIKTTTEIGKDTGGTKVTDYTYEVDLLVGLTDRPIQDVARVWSNGKLVWSRHADSDVDTMSAQADAPWDAIDILTGAEGADPWSVYEAVVGVGNAPAYRGRGAVGITALQLGNTGLLPNLTFEVVVDGVAQLQAADEGPKISTVVTFNVGTGAGETGTFEVHVGQWDSSYSTTLVKVYEVDVFGGEAAEVSSYSVANAVWGVATGTSTISCFLQSSGKDGRLVVDRVGTARNFVYPLSLGGAQVRFALTDAVMIAGSSLFGDKRLHRFDATGGSATVSSDPLADFVNSIVVLGDQVYAAGKNSKQIYRLDVSSLTLQQTINMPAFGGPDSEAWPRLVDANGDLFLLQSGNHPTPYGVYAYRSGTWQMVGSLSATETPTSDVCQSVSAVGNVLVGGHVRTSGSVHYATWFAPMAVDPSAETLEGVVDALCARAGMPAGTWDATALAAITTPVRAFTIGQVGSTRAALEQLMAAYFFEAYATDKLYFIPRAAASAMTIDADDLGTGLEEPADELLPMTIGNEMEVPAQISLSYSNADADYNIATEHSDRLLSGQPSTSAVQLPLGMTASEAKTVADAMLVDGLASRTTGSMTLPMAYAELVPTDVVTVPDDDGNTYRVRIVRRGDEGPLIRLDWVLDDATAVESAGITSDDYTPELDVPLRPDTLIEPMDIPILRDADDGPGVYVAAQGETTPWPGALVMASTDDVSFNAVADVAEAAVFGSCTSVLDDWSGGWVIDMDGSVEVDVGDGTLSSTTRDALLADRTVNAMLVGDEVIRFMTAAAGAPGVYTLSGLLRGQLGTEASCTGHGASERCVLLRPQGLRRVPTSLAARGQTYYVRGITRGQSLASVASETFTDLGVGMMPYAPVDVRGVRTTEHIVVTWKRRSRYVTSVTGILSAPLGEATEAYRVTILSSGGAALREVDTDEPVLYYDVDDVESDYGSLPPMIMLSIAQLGAGGIVGRTTTVALEVNTGVEVPGGGVTPDDGEQTPTLDLQIWHAGGSNVLVYRPVEGVAASLYVSSGTTLTAQAWPATPRPISRGVYYSDQLSIVVGASYYRLGFYTPFVPGTSSPTTLVGHVVPSAIGSAPVAVGDPPDYMIGGTTPPRCLGYDGTTVYGISMDRQDGALWSADSWPDPTGWTSVGALTQTGTESSPPWPWWQEGLNRLLKTTAGWIYVHSDGVWRTTQAVPQTGWDRIEAVSNDTGGWPHSPWWHLDALVDGARVYLCGPEYCAVSTDSGATWTVTSLPAPVPTNPYTIPDATFSRLGKLGANVVAITDGGTRVAINDGSGTGWTEHATSGIETYPTQYAGNRGRVDHAVSDGTRLWVVEREIVSQVAITPADPVTYSRFRVRVSTDGVNYSSPEFA